ncbi:MAG: hypothetical protein K2Q06_01710 [Parvularculaceae bacterium]|nr:hypothetical protein [Parvularculaceae bacterium]
MTSLKTCLAAALFAGASSAALAQGTAPAAPQTPQPPATATEPATPNPDEMASTLNKQQTVRETYTLTRTIDGKVVETTQRSIVTDPGAPDLPSEASASAVERLKEQFANEALTRTDAYEEAKLDFAAADALRRGRIGEDDFVALVEDWRQGAVEGDDAGRRRMQAFTQGLDKATVEAAARAKFRLMAGSETTLTRKQYVRETMIDFDAVDANKDRFLRGEELMKFRAVTTGASIASIPAQPVQAGTPPLLQRQ